MNSKSSQKSSEGFKIWLVAILALLMLDAVLFYPRLFFTTGATNQSAPPEVKENQGEKLPSVRATNPLPPVEVKEYQGEKLSPIVDVKNVSINGTPKIDINNYSLSVAGLVATPRQFSYSQILALTAYSKVVQINCVEGWSAKILWEGVRVVDLLDPSGVKPGAQTVIFYAADGYTTSLPLDYIRKNNILLAYKINGVTFPAEKGFPFQLVAEDKWGYKWIKWVTKIELSDNANYRGTYERAGYNINGDITGPKMGN